MLINKFKTNSINFKGRKSLTILPEKPSQQDFIGNVVVNSAAELCNENKQLSFIPAGSWITGQNYDRKLSDHDITILLPNNKKYSQQEADVFDIRNEMKKIITEKLVSHNIPEKDIEEEILQSINIFPTPQIQGIFDSYDQFIKSTNLKISLDKQTDADKGLWQMKGVVVNHFKNEGTFLTTDDNSKIQYFRIKDNTEKFDSFVKTKGFYFPMESEIYTSDKLKIINEFIEKLNSSEDVSIRSFHKYLQRIFKFIVAPSRDDLFMVSNDPRKQLLPKYASRIETETEYKNLFTKMSNEFNLVKKLSQVELSDSFRDTTIENLTKFKSLAEEIMSWPSLRKFPL